MPFLKFYYIVVRTLDKRSTLLNVKSVKYFIVDYRYSVVHGSLELTDPA